MSVEDIKVIDIISLDKEEKEVILTISDHLEWDNENEHLLILQDKLNTYLAAIEGGDLYVQYPKANKKSICIQIVALHSPNEDGLIFLQRTKEIIENAGYRFFFKQQP